MLSRLNVASKLTLAFGALLLMMLFILLVGILNMSRMNDASSELFNDRYAKTVLINDAIARTFDNGRSLRNLLLVDDPMEIDANLKIVQANRSKIDEDLARLDRMAGDSQARERVRAVIQLHDALEPKYARMIESFRLDRAQATIFMLKDFAPTNTAYAKAMRALADFQGSLMAEGALSIAEAFSSTRRQMLWIGGFALVASVIMAMGITVGLVRQLGGEPGEVVRIAGAIASGDLSIEIDRHRAGQGSVVAAMGSMRDQLAQVVAAVRNSSESIANGSTEIASGSANLSHRTEEQACNLQQTASTMEHLTRTVQLNAEVAQQANVLARKVRHAAEAGGHVVNESVATMQEIVDASRKVSSIVDLIDGISFQTNILALNAAVEAARAGNQGRGFAVVASEVRTLAQRSSEAAKEIRSLVGASVSQAEHGASKAHAASNSMENVLAEVQKVTGLIDEIARSSAEQSSGIGEVGHAMLQLDRVTQQNAALVEEGSAAAESLRGQAQCLLDLVSRFKVAASAESAFA